MLMQRGIFTARTSLRMLGTETALQEYQFPDSCAHLTHYHIPVVDGIISVCQQPAQHSFCSKGLGKAVLSGSTGSLSMG